MSGFRYPLGEHHPDWLHTANGLKLEDITLQAVLEGRVNSNDLTISSDTLWLQAAQAEEAGFPHVADNLRRAAELVNVPAEDILSIYTAVRPRRSTYAELMKLADQLERGYEAELVAGLIREAAEAYQAHGLLRSEG